MCKVNYEFIAVKYRVLGLDEPIPNKRFFNYEIDGKQYKPVPVYDLPGCIAIDDEGKSLMDKKFNLYDTDCRGRVNIVDKHIEL